MVLWSNDKGDSWHNWGTIAIDPAGINDYTEPSLLRLPDGRLISMLRMHQIPRMDPPGGYLHITISEDYGSTWSLPRRTKLWGYPADLINLQDGRVLCVYGRRRYPDPGVRGCVSEDGVTWKPEDEFIVRAVPDLPPALMHIGYPSTVQRDDGTIVTVYHLYWWDWEEDTSIPLEERRDLPPLPRGERVRGRLPYRQYVEAALYRL